MKSLRQMMVFMPLVVVLIGQFGRDVISRQDLKVAVTTNNISEDYSPDDHTRQTTDTSGFKPFTKTLLIES